MNKVFIVGFGKCGTVSLHRFLQKSGYTSIHNSGLHDNIMYNIKNYTPVLSGYEDYDAIINAGIRVNRNFRLIVKQYPDILFILNIRNTDNWVRSRINWKDTFNTYCKEYGFTTKEQVENYLRCIWYAHNNAVKYHIPTERLLIFDIENDNPDILCDFLNISKNYAKYYQHYNKSNYSQDICIKPNILYRLKIKFMKNIIMRIMRRRYAGVTSAGMLVQHGHNDIIE